MIPRSCLKFKHNMHGGSLPVYFGSTVTLKKKTQTFQERNDFLDDNKAKFPR